MTNVNGEEPRPRSLYESDLNNDRRPVTTTIADGSDVLPEITA